MPQVICKICGKKFYTKPRHLKIGWGKYCSNQCKYESQKTGKFVKCEVCGKKIYRTPKELRHSKSRKYFCSKSCFAIWKNENLLFGEHHPGWKHGKYTYRTTIKRNKIPQKCSRCGINDRRVLVVHHKDNNRKNNNIKNLEWLCRNCHYILHKGKTL